MTHGFNHSIHFCKADRSYQFSVFSSVKQLDETWNNLLPEKHHLRAEELAVWENCQLPDIGFRYMIVYEKDVPSGVVYLQRLRFNEKHYDPELLNQAQWKLLKHYLHHTELDLLICGNLFRIHFQGYYFKQPDGETILPQILDSYCAQINSKKICGILIKDCSVPLSEKVLSATRFKAMPDDMTMELQLNAEWKTFDDYLQALSKNYRQRAKKILAAAHYEKKELDADELLFYSHKIDGLYGQVANRQSLRIGTLTSHYFHQMKKHYGARFKVTGYFLNDEMIAFHSFLYHPTFMEIHYIGLDYRYNTELKLYFNILFDGIKEAIEQKYKRLELGRTAREAKASAGANPVHVRNYIRIKRNLARIAFSFFSGSFSKAVNNNWEKRSPFKLVRQDENTDNLNITT